MEWNDLLHILLIVCPLVFLGGIVDAVAGGGGLITLPAYLLAGLDPHAASATNKCGNVWGTLLSAYRFWRRGEIRTEDRSGQFSPLRLSLLSLGIGLAIGCYDGFFGPGAGTFLMLAYTSLCKFDLLTASGNTKAANAASNAASLVPFARAGEVVWAVGIPAALCGLAGGYVGSGLALRGGAKVIRPMFFVVLTILTVRLIYDLLV